MKAFLNKIKPKLVRIGVSLLLAGLVIMTGSFFATRGKLGIVRSSGKWQYPYSSDYVVNGALDLKESSFSTITIDTVGSHINLIPSDHFNLDYTYYKEGVPPIITQDEGILSIKTAGSKNEGVTNMQGFAFPIVIPEPEINLYFPSQNEFQLVSLRSQSGAITAGGFTAKETILYNKYSSSTFTNITSDSLTVDSQSGYIQLEGLTVKELAVDAKYGSVDLSGANISQSGLIQVESGYTDLSGVTATNLTTFNKYGSFDADNIKVTNLKVNSSSGSISYEGEIYGQSELYNKHSSIYLTLFQPRNETSLQVTSKYGSIEVDGNDFEKKFSDNIKSDHSLKVSGDNSIQIDFS